MVEPLQAIYDQVCRHVRQTALLASIGSVLEWDERTMLPPGGGDYRAEQMALLSGLTHDRATDPQLGDWLSQLAGSPLADPESDSGVTLRRLKRQYDKKVKLPKKLVEELTRAAVLGQQAWQEARSKNDFAMFRPHLEGMIRLKQEQAESLGYRECRYDALLDEYEPDALTSEIAGRLAALRDELVPLVGEIRQSGRRADISVLAHSFPVAAQEEIGREAAARIGFDFNRGRLDVTAHPFCATLGPGDCRITTRYHVNHFNNAFFGILHEAGHGLYEQGLPAPQFGLPLGEAVSLGIHESQSRLWENMVGRSHAFWRHFYPETKRRFPAALSDVTLDQFYAAINDVRPSLIRIEADEATYNLHIIVRFELEKALLEGQLKVADLPAAWNEAYAKYLGIEPTGPADGVLQDVHWAAGLIGYFPTYTLGNLNAAQFFAKADADLGGLSDLFAQGQFAPLLDWLRSNIHQHGQRYSADELVRHATGQPPSPRPLMAYLRAKLGPLYGLG